MRTRTLPLLAVLALAVVLVVPVSSLLAQVASPARASTSGSAWPSIPERGRGLYVVGISAGSPAEKARLPLDVFITEIDGQDVKASGMAGFQQAMQGKQPGTKLRVTYVDDRDRSKTVEIEIELMPAQWSKIADFYNGPFNSAYRTYRQALDSYDVDAMVASREAVAKVVEPMRREVAAGFKKPDEFYLQHLQAMGFLGRSERKALEKAFEKLTNPRTRRGQTPPVRLYSKMYICWALTAMQDPDTDEDVVKAISEAGETPEMSLAGCQLVCSMFADLEQDADRNARKIQKLSESIVEMEVIATLGNPLIDENLKGFCSNMDKVAGVDIRRLSPDDQRVIQGSSFRVSRAQWHCRALGWIRDRLSISYLSRAVEVSETQMKPVAGEALKRLMPDQADVTYEWYRENADYIDFVEDDGCFRFFAEAKAAGISAKDWRKENE